MHYLMLTTSFCFLTTCSLSFLGVFGRRFISPELFELRNLPVTVEAKAADESSASVGPVIGNSVAHFIRGQENTMNVFFANNVRNEDTISRPLME